MPNLLLAVDTTARGLRRMEGYVLATNARMRDFCRGLGFAIGPCPDDPTVRVACRGL